MSTRCTNSHRSLTRRWVITLATAVLLAGIAVPFTAWAQSLGEAKAAGTVGERIDGFVGLVSQGAPASTRALVERVNSKRRKHYAEIAAKTGASPREVAAVAGQKLVKKASAGEYIMGRDGHWVQR